VSAACFNGHLSQLIALVYDQSAYAEMWYIFYANHLAMLHELG
jgi:hypothetical protein